MPFSAQDKPYGKKSDVWALGCLTYEMLTLKHAFNGKSLPALILKIMKGTLDDKRSLRRGR